MELVMLKCPNCSGQLKIENNKESATCMHCGYEFLIYNKQPVITQNTYHNSNTINISNVSTTGTSHNNAPHNPNVPINLSTPPRRTSSRYLILLPILLILLFIVRCSSKLAAFTVSTSVPEIKSAIVAKTSPETLPMKLFVEYVFCKPTNQISKDEYSTIKHLEIYPTEVGLSKSWVFNYSFEDYDTTENFDSTIQQLSVSSDTNINVSDLQVFSGLTSLSISGGNYYGNLTLENKNKLPPIVNSSTLTRYYSTFEDSYKYLQENVASPQQLKHVSVEIYTNSDLNSLLQYTNLESIHIGYLKNSITSTTMAKLGTLEKLTSLKIDSAKNVGWLSSIENLKSLEWSTDLEDNFDVLYELPNLVSLKLRSFRNARTLSFVKNMPNLEELSITNSSIYNIDPLVDNETLLVLELNKNHNLSDVSAITTLANLEELHLDNNSIKSVGDLSGLIHLKKLSLKSKLLEETSSNSSVESLLAYDVNEIDVTIIPEKTPNLTQLSLNNYGQRPVANIQSLSNLTMLKSLHLNGVYSDAPSDYSELISTISADSLHLENLDLVLFPHQLSENPNLLSLNISYSTSIYIYDQDNDLADNSLTDTSEFFICLPNLEALALPRRKIHSLNFVNQIPNLKKLDLPHNEIYDLSPLNNLTNLESLNLEKNPIPNRELLPEGIHLLTGKAK